MKHIINRPDSSQIKSAEYDTESQILTVTFTTDSVYEYYCIPEETWWILVRAESVGKTFNREIKGKYSYKKV